MMIWLVFVYAESHFLIIQILDIIDNYEMLVKLENFTLSF